MHSHRAAAFTVAAGKARRAKEAKEAEGAKQEAGNTGNKKKSHGKKNNTPRTPRPQVEDGSKKPDTLADRKKDMHNRKRVLLNQQSLRSVGESVPEGSSKGAQSIPGMVEHSEHTLPSGGAAAPGAEANQGSSLPVDTLEEILASGSETECYSDEGEDIDECKELLEADEFCNKMLGLARLFREVKFRMEDNLLSLQETDALMSEVNFISNLVEKKAKPQSLVWKISDFKLSFRMAKEGDQTTLYSPDFYTNKIGYRLALTLCPYGDGKAEGKYMSLFFCILQGEHDSLLPWPFARRVTFSLLNLNGERGKDVFARHPDSDDDIEKEDHFATFKPSPIPSNYPFLGRPSTMRNPSLGLQRFISHKDLWRKGFVKDDTICIRVIVNTDGLVPV